MASRFDLQRSNSGVIMPLGSAMKCLEISDTSWSSLLATYSRKIRALAYEFCNLVELVMSSSDITDPKKKSRDELLRSLKAVSASVAEYYELVREIYSHWMAQTKGKKKNSQLPPNIRDKMKRGQLVCNRPKHEDYYFCSVECTYADGVKVSGFAMGRSSPSGEMVLCSELHKHRRALSYNLFSRSLLRDVLAVDMSVASLIRTDALDEPVLESIDLLSAIKALQRLDRRGLHTETHNTIDFVEAVESGVFVGAYARARAEVIGDLEGQVHVEQSLYADGFTRTYPII